MEWMEALLFLIFVAIPLLQGLFSRRQKPQDGTPLPQGQPGAATPDAGQVATASEPSAWDELFGTASLPPDAEEQDLEALQGDSEPLEVVSLEPVDELQEVKAPEVLVAADAAPPLDRVWVDRGAEHNRFHQRYLEVQVPERAQPRLTGNLHEPEELRRAIILAEVLGPPKCLQ